MNMTYLDSPMAAFFPTVLTIFDFGQFQGEMGGGGGGRWQQEGVKVLDLSHLLKNSNLGKDY